MYLEGEIVARHEVAFRLDRSESGSRCAACPARAGAICAKLDDAALHDFHQISRHKVLRKGQTLIWQGDAVSSGATIVSGMLKLSAATPDGREQILGLLGPGGFVGDRNRKRARYDVVALADTELCQFSGADLSAFARQHPEVLDTLLDKTIHELDRAQHWLMMLGRASAAERVATLLLDFAGPDLRADGDYSFPLSRGQMADLCGLTIETISRQLGSLKRSGVIQLPQRSRFIVSDPDALTALAGLSPATASH